MGNKSRKKRRGEFVMFESWKEREFEKKMERFRTALQGKKHDFNRSRGWAFDIGRIYLQR